ncbi:MAG: phosphodiester glycosidase family protein [Cyanobacteria bacterium P01_D01_bin.156]
MPDYTVLPISSMSPWHSLKKAILWLVLVIPIGYYGVTVWQRPKPHTIKDQPLFQGITYSRHISPQPRPHILHIVDIDLKTPGLSPFVTQAYAGLEITKRGISKRYSTRAQRTSKFLETHQLQLAINANFFLPFKEVTPWYYIPRTGQEINLVGLAMSEGKVVTAVNPHNKPAPPAVCFRAQQAVINSSGTCEKGTQYAVAGNLLLLQNGQTTHQLTTQVGREGERPYSLTIVALDKTGTRLWLVLVDGKQPFYSEGLTLAEVVKFIQTLGAETAVRLDGGGSTTLVTASPTGPKLLNTPIHSKVPGRERPVGNHLGFWAAPASP